MIEWFRSSLVLPCIAIGLLFLLTAPAFAGDAEALELVDLDGGTVSLESLRGDVVVLNFWATWCAPCIEEMPLLVALQRDLGPDGVQVIGASADEDDTQGFVRSMAAKLGVNFPVWLGATTADMERFGLAGTLPGTVILDRSGVLRARHDGLVTESWLRETVRALLDGAPRPDVIEEGDHEAREGHGDHDRHEPGEGHEAHAAGEDDERRVKTARARRPRRDAATVPS